MDKPLTIKLKEVEEQLVKVVNESGLPPCLLLNIVGGIENQLKNLDAEEIDNYVREQNMAQIKKKKGSDK